MADTKISALTAATSVAAADQFAIVQSGASKAATLTVLQQSLGTGYRNTSTSTVSAAYASDTYLAGSAVTVPAGAWKVGTLYQCGFDMVKTAAGTGAFTVTIRMGTLGTTGDAAILSSLGYGIGTAAVDTGWFEVYVVFRSVGSGTSAVIQGSLVGTHHLAATGLFSTGASGTGILIGTSSGFNSTTQTIIGVSVNGGASFSGTNTIVQSYVIL